MFIIFLNIFHLQIKKHAQPDVSLFKSCTLRLHYNTVVGFHRK